MRADLIATVLQGHLVLADGSMGAMLQARGLPAGVLPEVWNLERPDVVRAVHRAYVEAGAQMLVTNTIGGNRLRLEGAGLGAAAMVIAMNRAAATLAREVAGDEVWVAGSVGPTGMLMAPYGELSVAEAEEMFAEQIVALAEGGVDAILIETQHDGDEAYAAVRAARENAALPVLCTFAFDVRGRTLMGLRPDEAARPGRRRRSGGCQLWRGSGGGGGRAGADARRLRAPAGGPGQRRHAASRRARRRCLGRDAGRDGRSRSTLPNPGRRDHRRLLRHGTGAHRCDERRTVRHAIAEPRVIV
jgi:hypothetical protein